jgi:hypothetical protein
VHLFYDRVSQDASGAFDGVDIEAAREETLKKISM